MKCLAWMIILAVTVNWTARADVFVMWENNHLGGTNLSDSASTTAGEAPSAGTWNTNLAAAPVLGRGAGETVTSYTNTFPMRNANAVSLADAIISNRYLTFTLTTQPGKAMNFTNIFARLQAQNATDYAVSFTLMSDAIGFNEEDAITTWTVGGTGNSSDWLGQVRTFDLSNLDDLQNVTNVEFRIYIHGQQGGAFAQVGIGRAFEAPAQNADLRLEGEFQDVSGPDPDPEVSILSITVSSSQAVITWSELPAGYDTTVWWAPEIDADVVDHVALATGLPPTLTNYVDTVQHAEERGFYWTESTPPSP